MSPKAPKVSQRVPKVSRKGARGVPLRYATLHFGSNCPLNSDEKVDTKIDTEKVMKIDENSMRVLINIFIFFETCVPEKSYFSKRANVRKPDESCSRIRVGEGSPEDSKIKKMRKHIKTTSKK